jgi:hypothetical protein
VSGVGNLFITTITGSNRGTPNVLADATVRGSFDGYSCGVTYVVKVGPWLVDDSYTHTVTLKVTNNKNASSSGYYAMLDNIKVKPAVGPGTYLDNDVASALFGAWSIAEDEYASGGTKTHSNETDGMAWLTVEGAGSFSIATTTGSNRGVATCDVYSPDIA